MQVSEKPIRVTDALYKKLWFDPVYRMNPSSKERTRLASSSTIYDGRCAICKFTSHVDWKTIRTVRKKMFELLVLKKEQGNANSFSQDSVTNSVDEFKYSSEKEVIFAAYFRLYKEVFPKDGKANTKRMLTTYFREIVERYRLRRKNICGEKFSILHKMAVLKPDSERFKLKDLILSDL